MTRGTACCALLRERVWLLGVKSGSLALERVRDDNLSSVAMISGVVVRGRLNLHPSAAAWNRSKRHASAAEAARRARGSGTAEAVP